VHQRKYLAIISAIHLRQRQTNGRRRIDDVIFAEVSEKFGLSTDRIRNIYYDWAPRPVKRNAQRKSRSNTQKS
jgi:hypothetical protein